MAETTKIQWCHKTFNPWIGCTKVAPGCANCYAEADMDKRRGRVQWGPNGSRSRTSDSYWRDPIKWNKAAQESGERHRVFCASLADVFEDWNGPIIDSHGSRLYSDYIHNSPSSDPIGLRMSDMREDLFRLIDATPNLDWLLLTKRPENIGRMWCSHSNTDGKPPSKLLRSNVWLGTSISDQATANKAIPELLRCRDLAPVLFLSAEPLLGPIDLGAFQPFDGQCYCQEDPNGCKPRNATGCPAGGIDWMIDGAESGPNKRPYDLTWSRDLQSQCQAAGVAYFRKQVGDAIPGLRDKKGGDWDEWPVELRVREFPIVKADL